MEAFAKLGRRALSPERWQLLARHLEGLALKPYLDATPRSREATIIAPVEIEGVLFLPAVYYPA